MSRIRRPRTRSRRGSKCAASATSRASASARSSAPIRAGSSSSADTITRACAGLTRPASTPARTWGYLVSSAAASLASAAAAGGSTRVSCATQEPIDRAPLSAATSPAFAITVRRRPSSRPATRVSASRISCLARVERYIGSAPAASSRAASILDTHTPSGCGREIVGWLMCPS